MKTYNLSFATIKLLRDDIAEVIVNEGVELNKELVDQYHDFLLSHLTKPFSLLINKVNSYSYDAEAQENLATLKEINAMAVVAYSRTTRITTEDLASYPRSTKWNLRIFPNRLDALAWLSMQQAGELTDSSSSNNDQVESFTPDFLKQA